MKIILKTSKIVAFIQLALGLIHCAFTPVILKNIPPEITKVFLTMFLIAGMAFIYIGLVLLREVNQILRDGSTNLRMINISFGFILLAGILAAATMTQNPFAWLSLIVGLSGAIIVYGKQLLTK